MPHSAGSESNPHRMAINPVAAVSQSLDIVQKLSKFITAVRERAVADAELSAVCARLTTLFDELDAQLERLKEAPPLQKSKRDTLNRLRIRLQAAHDEYDHLSRAAGKTEQNAVSPKSPASLRERIRKTSRDIGAVTFGDIDALLLQRWGEELPALVERAEKSGALTPRQLIAQPQTVHFQLLPEVPGWVKKLIHAEQSAGSCKYFLAEGPAGFGKSSAALEIALRLQKHRLTKRGELFPYGIFFVNLQPTSDKGDCYETAVLDGLKALVRLVGSSAEITSGEGARQELNNVLQDNRCLIVLDNVWDKDSIQAFMYSESKAIYFVTSRDSKCLEGRPRPVRFMFTPELNAAVSTELFLSIATDNSREALRDADKEEARRLVEKCKGCLHAVAAIACVAKREGRGKWGRLAANLQRNLKSQPSISSKGTVYDTVNYSIKHMINSATTPNKRKEISDRLLALEALSVFRSSLDIPLGIIWLVFVALSGQQIAADELKHTLDELVGVNLLERRAMRTYRLHDIMGGFLANYVMGNWRAATYETDRDAKPKALNQGPQKVPLAAALDALKCDDEAPDLSLAVWSCLTMFGGDEAFEAARSTPKMRNIARVAGHSDMWRDFSWEICRQSGESHHHPDRISPALSKQLLALAAVCQVSSAWRCSQYAVVTSHGWLNGLMREIRICNGATPRDRQTDPWLTKRLEFVGLNARATILLVAKVPDPKTKVETALKYMASAMEILRSKDAQMLRLTKEHIDDAYRTLATIKGWQAAEALKAHEWTEALDLANEAKEAWDELEIPDSFKEQELGALEFIMAVHGIGDGNPGMQAQRHLEAAIQMRRQRRETRAVVAHLLELLQNCSGRLEELLELEDSFPDEHVIYIGNRRYRKKSLLREESSEAESLHGQEEAKCTSEAPAPRANWLSGLLRCCTS